MLWITGSYSVFLIALIVDKIWLACSKLKSRFLINPSHKYLRSLYDDLPSLDKRNSHCTEGMWNVVHCMYCMHIAAETDILIQIHGDAHRIVAQFCRLYCWLKVCVHVMYKGKCLDSLVKRNKGYEAIKIYRPNISLP